MKYRKIIDYQVIHHYSLVQLRIEVQELISNGWQPFGDCRVIGDGHMPSLYQTMIKYGIEGE